MPHARRAIDVGGNDSAGILGLSDLELDRVSARTVTVGSAAAGPVAVSAAVQRTADTSDGDDQHLWPCRPEDADEETIFQSPRMTELVNPDKRA